MLIEPRPSDDLGLVLLLDLALTELITRYPDSSSSARRRTESTSTIRWRAVI